MVEISLSILALIISIFSFVLSFVQSRDKSFGINHIQVKTLDDSYDLLFNDNSKFLIELINFNNRDLLIYLYDGYICINNEIYSVNSRYSTIYANSVTKVEAKLSKNNSSHCSQKYSVLLKFKYKGLLLNRTFMYKEKCKEKTHE